MTREKRLKKEAMESAHWRGHTFKSKWEVLRPNQIFSKKCKVCGAWMHVNLKPAPNGIDIGGSAVAVNCKI